MAAAQPVTYATITLVVSIVGGWIWANNHFMVRSDADVFHVEFAEAADVLHAEFAATVRKTYLELKIDQHNGTMAFIEDSGIDESERREYDLLKFGVERMTDQLLELR
jgi:hypothetical protein